MLKFSKAQIKEHTRQIEEIKAAHEALEIAVTAFNETMATARDEVEEAQASLAALVAASNDWRRSLVEDDFRPEWDLKSEKWQDGEPGAVADSWLAAIEQEIEPPELEFPDELAEPETIYLAELDDMPTEPEDQ